MSTSYFTKIDNSILELDSLTPIQKMVYVILKKHADFKTFKCYPSLTTIAKQVNCHKNSVINAIKKLEELKLIVKFNRTLKNKKEKTSNMYIVNPNTQIVPPSTIDVHKQELSNNNDIDIEKVDTKEMDVEEIKKALQKKYSARAVTQALYQLKQRLLNNKPIFNIISYLEKICKNFQLGLDLCATVKQDLPITNSYTTSNLNKGIHNKKQANTSTTSNTHTTTYKKTKFHNFEERFEKYTPEEFEKIALASNKKKFATV